MRRKGQDDLNARAKVASILQDVSREFNIDIMSIRDRSVHPHYVAARREICKRADAAGVGCVIIGDIIHRDHTVVLYNLSARVRELKALNHRNNRAYRREQRLRREARKDIGAGGAIPAG